MKAKFKWKWLGLVLVGLWLIAAPASAQDGQPPIRVEAERVPAGPEPALPTPLSLDLSDAFVEGRNVYDLGPVSPEQIAAADREAEIRFTNVNPRPPRVGIVRSVGATPLSFQNGAALQTALPDGKNVWTLAIRSPGAYGMRVHVSAFDVGAGSAILYAHEPAAGVVARGPFTGKGPHGTGEFWSASLPGDIVFIEVSGTDAPRLEISEIMHFDKSLSGEAQSDESASLVSADSTSSARPAQGQPGQADVSVLQPVLTCHLDVMCYGSPPVNPAARDATGQMNFVVGGSGFICSGTIVNDLDGDTRVPYFLTAHHCLHTQTDVNTLEVVYLWQRASCGGTLPNYWTLPRTNGGTLLATNPTVPGNDMTFIRLAGDVPSGVTLAGWTNAGLPGSITGIHHPAADWKRVSFGHGQLVANCTGSGLPLSQYHYILWNNGATEGGSSGSAIFDNDALIYGQLYGFCAPQGFQNWCSQLNQWNAIYGRFDVTYPLIQRWLEMGGTIHVNKNYVGVELGTPAQPFNTVSEANDFAWNGAHIKIKAGSYNETLTFSKQLTVLADGGTVAIGQ